MFNFYALRLPGRFIHHPQIVKYAQVLSNPSNHKLIPGQITQKRSLVRKVVFAAGFPTYFTKDRVEEYFRKRNDFVKFVRVLRDVTVESRFQSSGIAVIRYSRKSAASRCIEKYNGTTVIPGYVLSMTHTLAETVEAHKKVGNFHRTLLEAGRMRKVNKMLNPVVQTPSNTLYVGSLPMVYKAHHVKDLFRKFGKIVSVYKPEGPNKTFAHVKFESVECATDALKKMNGYQIKLNLLVIRYAYDRQDREVAYEEPKWEKKGPEFLTGSPVYRGLFNQESLSRSFVHKRAKAQFGKREKPDMGNIISPCSSLRLPGVKGYSPTGGVRPSKTYYYDVGAKILDDRKMMIKLGLDTDLEGDFAI